MIGRAAEGTVLERRRSASYREFESHIIRQLQKKVHFWTFYFTKNKQTEWLV